MPHGVISESEQIFLLIVARSTLLIIWIGCLLWCWKRELMGVPKCCWWCWRLCWGMNRTRRTLTSEMNKVAYSKILSPTITTPHILMIWWLHSGENSSPSSVIKSWVWCLSLLGYVQMRIITIFMRNGCAEKLLGMMNYERVVTG